MKDTQTSPSRRRGHGIRSPAVGSDCSPLQAASIRLIHRWSSWSLPWNTGSARTPPERAAQRHKPRQSTRSTAGARGALNRQIRPHVVSIHSILHRSPQSQLPRTVGFGRTPHWSAAEFVRRRIEGASRIHVEEEREPDPVSPTGSATLSPTLRC